MKTLLFAPSGDDLSFEDIVALASPAIVHPPSAELHSSATPCQKPIVSPESSIWQGAYIPIIRCGIPPPEWVGSIISTATTLPARIDGTLSGASLSGIESRIPMTTPHFAPYFFRASPVFS